MIINRTDILNACSRTGANINQILKNQLAEVKEEVIVQMDENQVDKERLSVERNNLMSGGVGKARASSNAINEPTEPAPAITTFFFSITFDSSNPVFLEYRFVTRSWISAGIAGSLRGKCRYDCGHWGQ